MLKDIFIQKNRQYFLNFDKHMKVKLAVARRSLGVMKQMKKWIDKKSLENLYML